MSKPQGGWLSSENGDFAGEMPIFINAGDNLDLNDTNTPSESLVPYKLLKNLGHGGSASVEKVEDVHTGRVYARKIFRNVHTRNLTHAKQRLRDEVQIMKRLAAHHHIVRVHATYIVKRELAIILDPVADGGDLASFLQDFRDAGIGAASWSFQCHILWKSFGCLASGLAFMHRQTIRHKDIKPQNILIHRGDVMYTDFGLSYDFGDTGQSTTTGIVQGMTKRYCAPEVARGASRNSKSDIFSLGCVYIEILEALEPGSFSEGILSGPFYETLDTCATDGNLPQYLGLSRLGRDVLLGQGLLEERPIDRPSASQVVQSLQFIDYGSWGLLHFCNRCKKHYEAEVGPFGDYRQPSICRRI
ncbi:kinase-like domain-containing protein [Paraphoma chrysanthemicola]|nr:kinase-like domain-containing protein [Paraphoma chrysanthemicola]